MSQRLCCAVILTFCFLITNFRSVAEAGRDPYVGEIVLLASNFAPRGFLPCEGQSLPIREYKWLFDLIGNRFGGDGKTEFELPDLRKVSAEIRSIAKVEDRSCLLFAICVYGANDDAPPRHQIGQIVWFASQKLPPHYAYCEGQVLANGFRVPDLRKMDTWFRELSGAGVRHAVRVPGGEHYAGNSTFTSEIQLFAHKGILNHDGSLALCNGTERSVPVYDALFSLIGTFYGGDGRDTFGVPDLRVLERKYRDAAGIKEPAARGAPHELSRSEKYQLSQLQKILAEFDPQNLADIDRLRDALRRVHEGFEGRQVEVMGVAPLTFGIAREGLYPSRT